MKKELSLRARKRSVLEFIEREREFDWIISFSIMSNEGELHRERERERLKTIVLSFL